MRREQLALALRAIARSVLWVLPALALYVVTTVLVGAVGLPHPDRRASFAVCFGIAATALLFREHRHMGGGQSVIVSSLAVLLFWVTLMIVGLRCEPYGIVGDRVRGEMNERGFLRSLALLLGSVPALLYAVPLASVCSSRRFDSARRGFAGVAVAIAGVATFLGISRVRLPDPDTYVDSLPVVGHLHAGDSLRAENGALLTYRGYHEGLDGIAANAGSLRLRYYGGDGQGVIVRHDARAGLWVFADARSHDAKPWSSDMTGLLERDMSARETVWARDLVTPLAPPLAWTFGGLVGFLSGAALLVAARHYERARLAASTWIEGRLDTHGWVALPDGAGVRMEPAPDVPPGPLLLDLQFGSAGAYRTPAPITVRAFHVGSRDEVLTRLGDRNTSLYVLALVASLMCAAPLLQWVVFER